MAALRPNQESTESPNSLTSSRSGASFGAGNVFLQLFTHRPAGKADART